MALFITFILTGLLVLFIQLNGNLDDLFKTENVIQTAIFSSLVFYSLETFSLRKVTKTNLKFEQRPCMVPFIRHINDGSYHLKIRNVGKGVAIDVSIEIIDPKNDYSGKLRGNVKYMPTGDEKSIQFSGSKIDSSDSGRFNNTNLCNQKEGFGIKVMCKDASNNKMTPFRYEIKPRDGDDWEIYTKEIGIN